MLADEPDLEFRDRNQLAGHQIVSAVVVVIVGLFNQFASFFEDDLVGFQQAADLHGHFFPQVQRELELTRHWLLALMDPLTGVTDIVDVTSGGVVWTVPDGLGLVAMTPGGVIVEDSTTGSRTLFDLSGAEIGSVARLLPESDQLSVAPVVDGAHRVVQARGCPGRG